MNGFFYLFDCSGLLQSEEDVLSVAVRHRLASAYTAEVVCVSFEDSTQRASARCKWRRVDSQGSRIYNELCEASFKRLQILFDILP